MRRAVLALSAVVVLAGCASGATSAHVATAPIDGAEAVEVVATEFAFEPRELTVPPGQPLNVHLRNDGRSQHDLASGELQLHVHAAPGRTEVSGITPSEPGRYELVCTIPGHLRRGMKMTLVVE